MTMSTRGADLAVAAGPAVLGAASLPHASSQAEAVTAGSPGVLAGGSFQVPVHVPVNFFGN